MAIGSGQVSFGTINTEISWASNRADTYFVNAGPTGATYSSYTTQSLYGYYGMRVYMLASVNDYNDGNYDLSGVQYSCEASYISTPPAAAQADTTVGWTWEVTYYDGFALGIQYDLLYIYSGNTANGGSYSFLCYVPGLCSVIDWQCNGTSPVASGSSSITGQSTFYIGYFRNTSRFKMYSCDCP